MALTNMTLHRRVEITTLEDTERLEQVRHPRRISKIKSSIPCRHLYLLTAAKPNTGWIRSCIVCLGRKGFMLTEARIANGVVPRFRYKRASTEHLLSATRVGSTKRTSAEVEEGAAVLTQIHSFLSVDRQGSYVNPKHTRERP